MLATSADLWSQQQDQATHPLGPTHTRTGHRRQARNNAKARYSSKQPLDPRTAMSCPSSVSTAYASGAACVVVTRPAPPAAASVGPVGSMMSDVFMWWKGDCGSGHAMCKKSSQPSTKRVKGRCPPPQCLRLPQTNQKIACMPSLIRGVNTCLSCTSLLHHAASEQPSKRVAAQHRHATDCLASLSRLLCCPNRLPGCVASLTGQAVEDRGRKTARLVLCL